MLSYPVVSNLSTLANQGDGIWAVGGVRGCGCVTEQERREWTMVMMMMMLAKSWSWRMALVSITALRVLERAKVNNSPGTLLKSSKRWRGVEAQWAKG